MDNVYDSLQGLIDETFVRDEDKDADIESYGNKGRYWIRVTYEKARGCWKEGLVGFLFFALFLHVIVQASNYIKFILLLDARYVSNEFCAAYIVMPFAVWAWSTAYDGFNFWNRKIRLFGLCVVHLFVMVLNFSSAILAEPIFWFWSCAPTDGLVTVSLLCGLARITLIILLAVPLTICCAYVLGEFGNRITRQALIDFKIKKILSQHKAKDPYAYDMAIVKNLETGRVHAIREKDRFVHAVGNGVTGTGKTSSTFIPAIESDLEQIVHNRNCQRKKCLEMLRKGKVRLRHPMTDSEFDIENFEGTSEKYEKELERLKMKIKVAGLTAVAPDASFADEVYQMAHVKGLKVNRIDPVLSDRKHLKPGFVGFNPLYISPGLNQIEFVIEAARKAIMWADVTQAVYDSEGMSDVYFASLNKQINSTVAMLLIFTFPAVEDRQPNPTDIQLLLSDFTRARAYRDKLIELYSSKDEYGRMEVKNGRPKMTLPIFQTILDVVDNELLGPGAEKMNDQCRGLRNIINSFLADLNVQNVFCHKESVDIEKAFERGEITVLNFALELGTSGRALGLFYLLSMIQAAFRRKGTEDTRIPNFCYIDEFPQLLHPSAEQCFVLFRKYRIAMFVAIQSSSQMDKNRSTAFMKPVILGNCAHHFVFGRTAMEEMQYYEALAGVCERQSQIESVNETSLISDNPSISYQHRTQTQMENKLEGGRIRERDFQEVTVVTVDESNPVGVFFGKLSFMPRYKKRVRLQEKELDWMEYYAPAGNEYSGKERAEAAKMESPLLKSARMTAEDDFDVKIRKEGEGPAFMRLLHEMKEEEGVEGERDADVEKDDIGKPREEDDAAIRFTI